MKQLELRFYSREELSETFKVDAKDKNFARKIKDALTSWGYSFEYGRKGAVITRQPQTSEEKLAEILMREYDMDIRVNCYDYAVFIYSLLVDVEFISMPWLKRVEYLQDEWGVKVSERTLRQWTSKLIKTNTIAKDTTDKTYWVSFMHNGEKCQEVLEKGRDDIQWKTYWKKFFELQKSGCENIGGKLWEELHYCCYSCASLAFNAWDDIGMLEELIFLVEEIAEKEPFDNIIITNTEIINKPRVEVIDKPFEEITKEEKIKAFKAASGF